MLFSIFMTRILLEFIFSWTENGMLKIILSFESSYLVEKQHRIQKKWNKRKYVYYYYTARQKKKI